MNYGRVDLERLIVIRVMTWAALMIYFFPALFLIMLMIAGLKPASLASVIVCLYGFFCSYLMCLLYSGFLSAYRKQRAAAELRKTVCFQPVHWDVMKERTGLKDKTLPTITL